ncbi:acetyl/propionyl/methylcrotonyl-CoA carboxylase subunit alpha [Pseudodonghicola xiamenensis]|uniref:3-methylcrotonyl-CoA carboxylase subunit alpha n=1 Tax=Pseudodonghicola xiamenensis TaxID=337702 RepID=A0A8J3H755_9RHOB|nr:acetyl-CoA carboxylase biotin carboxylase subunit [Pseudodonghicola xiamenensis]GHG86811.1 3-methylcrotonyl-CoA carboxylase subunit alpha [Pseudodonghicola xiamenensis]
MDKSTPFTKLLVANRSEIALRVMRTAKAMGYATVAVYSEADAGAEHLRAADQAICIGGAAPSESYLRIDRIIAAARATGADAIHPGYGFLAENPDFPEACAEAGIVFVGPSAAAIRAMGDKAGAKALMIEAGVPCVPGYQGADQAAERLLAEARRIGFPVMIKATAGGGGRGMRLVAREEEFPEALRSATSEAKSAFGSDVVLLEKAILNPRHVEIQVMADRHGNAIHLGERDCSVQRRHQKLIEEAPSPAVDVDLRARMGAASLAAVRAIGYEGAGTFEYLLDASGAFYFMEMNTRLQVEHPVTEAITGLDLVALQLRVAAGEALPLRQEDVTFSGHAIEVRLCAEDPQAGFMPQSGAMARWAPAPGIRADHALRDGAPVPQFYDSMIAKLIAHGPDREAARRRLIAGLEGTVALGLRSNQDFLTACLVQSSFQEGAATTGFIEENRDDLLPETDPAEARAAMILAALLRAGPRTGLAHSFPTPLRLERNGTLYDPQVRALKAGACHVTMTGQESLELTVLCRDRHAALIECDGIREEVALLSEAATPALRFGGRSFDFRDLSFVPTVQGAAQGDGRVRATMNGSVVSVDVAVGDRVEAGQKVLVLEAMKMEHSHTAAVSGTVSAVHIAAGAQVTAHAVVIEIAPEAAPA